MPKKTTRSYPILAFLSVVLFTMGAHAQTEMSAKNADALRNKVKARAQTTKTISSDFLQVKHLDFLSNDIESSGKLAFKAPDMVKWAYTAPFAYSVVFKDQMLYINDDGNKNTMDVGANKLFKRLNELITASIRGDLFNEDEFTISYFHQGDASTVHFFPKDEQFAEFIQAFHITFNDQGDVDKVKMIEPSGDYTQIIFSNRSLNQPLSDADFAQ